MTGGAGDTAWRRAEEIFLAALAHPSATRDAFLERECGNDRALHAEVASLLEAHARDGALPALADPFEKPPFERIGAYRLLRRIGEGGMGAVYLAEREGTDFRQTVALKLIRAGFADASLNQRLRGERRILARLEHPGIARLIDGGVAPWGQPFLAMEYVPGRTLLEYCDGQQLTVRERLRLFLRVCDAVHYAHQHLVVHRDLKPGNLLVTPEGQPKLLDFGIAKLLDAERDESEVMRTAPWITPAYASPEQVRGESVGTACDVYALGLLLYEALVGRRAYQVDGRSAAEVERIICERVPTAPSMVVREGVPPAVLADRRTSAERLRRDLAGDIDTIVLRALAKDPARRYGSADQLAEDLRRYLDGRPVLARADTFAYRAHKFVQRHRTAVAAAALAAVALVTGSSLAIWQAGRATQQAGVAAAEAAKAQLVARVMVDLFRSSDPTEALGDTITARQILDRGTERIEHEFGEQPDVQAALLLEVSRVYRNLGLLPRAEGLVRRALSISEAAFGSSSTQASLALAQLGEVQAALGKRDSAILHLQRALAIRAARIEAQPDSVTAEMLSSLAWVLRDSGEHEQAAQLFERALDQQRSLYGEDAPRLAPVMLGLASAYHDRGRFDDAEALFERALSRADTTRPHPMAATALLNVGMLRRVREQYVSAEPLLRAALEQHERLYEPEHPAVLAAMVEWSRELIDLGRYGEAQEVVREGLHRALRTLGEAHPLTSSLRQTFAHNHGILGAYDSAHAHFDAVLAAKRRQYGGDHPDLVFALLQSAEPLLERGRAAAAASRVRESLAMGERLGSGGGVYQGLALRLLARVALQLGDPIEAERHIEAALRVAAERLRPDHRYSREFLRTRALVWLATGRASDAAGTLEAVLADDRRVLPAPHPQIGITLSLLGEAYLDAGRAAEAGGALREAARHLEPLGGGHWRVGSARNLLGAALVAAGQSEQGRAPLLEGLAIVRAHLGGDSEAARRAQRRIDAARPSTS